jgi:ribulose-phosphate 3-epimerase
MIEIEPSILSADFTKLGEAVIEAQNAGVKGIQIDVMDGRFVPNINFGPGAVSAIRPITKMFLDVHLMIVEPEKYIEDFVKAGADQIIVHQETCPHLHRTLQSIREYGIKSGVTLNPATPSDMIKDVLELTDFVQVMGVNPGFGGQKFIYSQLDKIRTIKSMLKERDLDVPIGVDGGVGIETAPLIVEAGATILIAGSSVYNTKATVKENVYALLKSVQ